MLCARGEPCQYFPYESVKDCLAVQLLGIGVYSFQHTWLLTFKLLVYRSKSRSLNSTVNCTFRQ
jgi:hypothetical protein